ncbi:MAG TPA: hypothetical protein EYH39_03925 [Desulfurobacteriaceae bacterium]|nr:hypothetical protein [Desulfurobacteriaceae bacterium]
MTKKTLRDIYFEFLKLLEEKKKIVVSPSELANILESNPLMVNILIKALKNSKEIEVIEKGEILEITPIYRLKDVEKFVENIFKTSSLNNESENKEINQKENQEEKSKDEKNISKEIKVLLKSNETLSGEFVEEDDNILCLDSQKYRYLIYKNSILNFEDNKT